MNAHNASIIIAELEHIVEHGPRSEVRGLCSNLLAALVAGGAGSDYMFDNLRIDLHPAFESWLDYSGDKMTPVPSDIPGESPSNAYWSSKPKWEGEYGESRMSLVRHCLQCFKDAYNV